MRTLAILVAVLVAIFVGNFVYTLYVRPIDQPTPDLQGLERHFNSSGITGHMYAVRHSFSHSRVRAVAAFEIKNYPLPFGLVACATQAEAAERSRHDPRLPEELQPRRNGLLVLDFPAWGDDTFRVAQGVKSVFDSYRAEP